MLLHISWFRVIFSYRYFITHNAEALKGEDMGFKKNISLLNRWVEIHSPASSTDQSSKTRPPRIWRGKISQTDRDTLVINCYGQEGYMNCENATVTVKVLDNTRESGAFSTKVRRHFYDPEEEKETLVVAYPKAVQVEEVRENPRVELKLPGRINAISSNGETLPLEVRRQVHPVVIRDVSETGVQVLTTTQLPERAQVVITFRLDNTPIRENADVMWSRVAMERYYLYGLQFRNPDSVTKQIIRTMHSRS